MLDNKFKLIPSASFFLAMSVRRKADFKMH